MSHGFIFYLEPRTMGVTAAYWGPESRLGLPQPALTFNLGAATNVTSLQFTQDALAPVGTKGSFLDPVTKVSTTIPPLPSLRVPPLELRPVPARRIVLQRSTARSTPAQAATTAQAAVTEAPDPVSATGELETVRYGGVLRARRLVGVRGAGLTNNGDYIVSRVTHNIDVAQGKSTQSFTLKREGTGALLPVVRP